MYIGSVIDTIFMATAVEEVPAKRPLFTRHLGWHSRKSDLLEDINNKGEDICECRFSYIVIEEVSCGIWGHPKPHTEVWLRYNDVERKWELCAKPPSLQGVVHWNSY